MPGLDVFHADPFKMIQLTAAIEKAPYVPGRLAQMGIFDDAPIRTKALMVESRQGKLTLVPMSDRGAPASERITERREARYFECPRLRTGDTLYAEEIAFIRDFGMEAAVMEMQKEIARRVAGPTGLRNRLSLTQEYHKLAAIQGLLLDVDGTVRYNWFNEFNITANSQVPFNLAANTAGTLRALCAYIVRQMARKAQGAFIEGTTKVVAFCGDSFFDALIKHTDVEKTYANWEAAAWMRQGSAFQDFNLFDIDWVNYRGTDDTLNLIVTLTNGSASVSVGAALAALLANGMQVSGPSIASGTTISSLNTGAGTFALSSGNYGGATGSYTINIGNVSGQGNTYTGGGAIAIPTNKAFFFPTRAPGIFQRGLAPAEGFDWINTLGKPEYAQMIPDRDRNEWVRAELSVYPLHICTRPEVLFSATMDNAVD